MRNLLIEEEKVEEEEDGKKEEEEEEGEALCVGFEDNRYILPEWQLCGHVLEPVSTGKEREGWGSLPGHNMAATSQPCHGRKRC